MKKHRYFYTVNGKRTEELVEGKWVKASDSQQAHSHLLIRDHLGDGVKGIFNHATGQRYDSRSRYLRDTKAAGCEVVGNDIKPRQRETPRVKESIPQTIERLNQQKGWNL